MSANARARAALLLAGGMSIVKAATSIGVDEKTIRRWDKDQEFTNQVNALRGELLARGMGVLVKTSTKAAMTLRKLLNSECEAIRLRAAVAILSAGSDLRRTVDQDQEIRELQATIERIESERKTKG